MIFTQTTIPGAMVVEMDKIGDERGFFARAFASEEFQAHGLPSNFIQANVSRSAKTGTLRGMHFQKGEFAEDKLVRCTKGKLFDIALDLRPESPAYRQWFCVELSSENHRALLIPKGCAHGFITLEDDTEAFYLVSSPYTPSAEGGVRYNDPTFQIQWPIAMTVISEKDANWPDFVNN